MLDLLFFFIVFNARNLPNMQVKWSVRLPTIHGQEKGRELIDYFSESKVKKTARHMSFF
jgi:hypothetical protein